MENLETIKNHNKVWYRKTYDLLIRKAQEIEKINGYGDTYTEVHHILPKCMGGDNSVQNLVKLDARSHIVAHMLLACIYPDNLSLLNSVVAMLMMSQCTSNREKYIKKVSSRLAAKFREEYGRAQRGKLLTKEHREKLSQSKLGKKRKNFSKETCDNISKGKKGKPYGTQVIDSDGIVYKTLQECSKKYGVCPSTIKFWIDNIPERGFRYYSGDDHRVEHPKAKKVIGPDGTVYKSLTDCAKHTNHDRHTISEWIKRNPEKGFKYEK